MIEVLEVGGVALIEDLGRPGLAHVGVSPSGAADRAALISTNRALGNELGAAALEVIGGLVLRAGADVTVAVGGALGQIEVDGVPAGSAVLTLAEGQELRLDAPRWGLRSYVGVRGGWDVTTVLGSSSADVLSGIGPAPVRPGDRLRVGAEPSAPVESEPIRRRPAALTMLDASQGPRADWIRDADELYRHPWQVSALGDRVGVRLEGEPLLRAITDELPSEGVVTGSVQLPPSGEPVILGPDHPVTGGYPVIAVLTAAACDAAAQLRPGDTVRFRRRA